MWKSETVGSWRCGSIRARFLAFHRRLSVNSPSGAGQVGRGRFVGGRGRGGGRCGIRREVAFSRFEPTRGMVIELGNRQAYPDIQEVTSPAGWRREAAMGRRRTPRTNRRTDGRTVEHRLVEQMEIQVDAGQSR